jgi:hypothetical protein
MRDPSCACSVEHELRWPARTASRFISVHQFAVRKSGNLVDLENIEICGLYFVAAPSVPKPAREEVITKAKPDEYARSAVTAPPPTLAKCSNCNVNQHSSRSDVLPHTIATIDRGNWPDLLHRLGVEGRDRGAYRTLPLWWSRGAKACEEPRDHPFPYLFLTCWRRSQWCAPLQNGARLRIIG